MFGFGSEGVGSSRLAILLSPFALALAITTVVLLEGWYFTSWWRPEHSRMQETLILHILMLKKSFLHPYSPGTHRASSPVQCPCSSTLYVGLRREALQVGRRRVAKKTAAFSQFFPLLGIVVPQSWGRNGGRAESGQAGRVRDHPLLQAMQWYCYLILALQVFSNKSVVVVCCQSSPISRADSSASPEYSHYLCGQ